MTQEKLAKLANVSVSTVSKAFSHSTEISEATRADIFRIAKENGCFDKYFKEKYEKYVIAVICPEFHSRFYANYLLALESEIRKYNSTMLSVTSDFSPEKEAELLEYFTAFAKVDGVIIVNSMLDKIDKYSLPVVSISKNLPGSLVSSTTSFDKALSAAAKLLIKNGHKKIGFIGERLTHKKEEYFIKCLENHGIEPNKKWFIKSCDRFEKAGFSGMEALFEGGDPPTAVLCAYDSIAIGAIHSIKKRGLSVPEDISVIGMDNIEETEYLNPPLTTIDVHISNSCRILCDILFRRIQNPHLVPQRLLPFDAELIVRQSVAKAKAWD